MNFQPLVPFSGYSGWAFLSRTLDSQTEAFAASPALDRDMDYFRANIGAVRNAADMVGDYRLLRVALGAFGLQEDLPNRAFISRVLGDDLNSDDALANRLSDKRYLEFSRAFGFGSDLPPRTLRPGFADDILARFERQEFERAVGEQSEEMRLALTAARELPEIAARGSETDTAWLTIMGNPPLRAVFETAFGLPSGVGTLDLDRQLEIFRDKATRILGTDSVLSFSSGDGVDRLIRNYLGRAQLDAVPTAASSASIALTLLQGAV